MACGGNCTGFAARGEPLMPFSRITVRDGWSDADLQTLSETLHEVLVAEFNVPASDRFQVIETVSAQRFIYDRSYLSGGRSDR